MLSYIDKKQLVTIVVAGIALFLLQKYLTKKLTKADGSTELKVGFDGLGHI
ncbi:hypothetical protein I5M32_11265 [Pedobacter sp. SD-b]|uniref:Uncharacterized protein n=1 Tax=Pedobacter segetis TaxID=2793069 RepID=A0ABS1BL12_9SPHI|nr:hypothetical protein [Pedobacter segetis]MBK0383536.1 hypothetical protein [Pedobacter segetis]